MCNDFVNSVTPVPASNDDTVLDIESNVFFIESELIEFNPLNSLANSRMAEPANDSLSDLSENFSSFVNIDSPPPNIALMNPVIH